MQHYQNYIAGTWRDSERSLTVMNPSTDEPCASIALASHADADDAMQAARACVNSGALTKVRPAERTAWLLALAQAIRAVTAQGTALLALENGKTQADARGEWEEAARYCEYYARMADKLEGRSIPLGEDYVDFTQYVPHGVSLHIIPWNFPVGLAARSLAPALAAGNAVVIKSPEVSPVALTVLLKACEQAGLPQGAVQLLCAEGADVGAYLVSHPETDHIVFTGSVPTGQHIMQSAAQYATPTVMELGGKSAGIVCADAQLDKVLESVRNGIFFNAGQVCSALARLLVHRSRYEEVKQAVVDLAEGLSVGPAADNPDITPLISRQQQERVLAMLQNARDEGANILCGGTAPDLPGYFINPTIIAATPDLTIAREEVFGPALVIMPYDDEAEAVHMANDSPYGLVAGVFGESLNQTLRLSGQLRAGQVFVNEWFAGGVETPFGGFGLSGFGREKGQEAIYGYVRTRNIAIRLS